MIEKGSKAAKVKQQIREHFVWIFFSSLGLGYAVRGESPFLTHFALCPFPLKWDKNRQNLQTLKIMK